MQINYVVVVEVVVVGHYKLIKNDISSNLVSIRPQLCNVTHVQKRGTINMMCKIEELYVIC